MNNHVDNNTILISHSDLSFNYILIILMPKVGLTKAAAAGTGALTLQLFPSAPRTLTDPPCFRKAARVGVTSISCCCRWCCW